MVVEDKVWWNDVSQLKQKPALKGWWLLGCKWYHSIFLPGNVSIHVPRYSYLYQLLNQQYPTLKLILTGMEHRNQSFLSRKKYKPRLSAAFLATATRPENATPAIPLWVPQPLNSLTRYSYSIKQEVLKVPSEGLSIFQPTYPPVLSPAWFLLLGQTNRFPLSWATVWALGTSLL